MNIRNLLVPAVLAALSSAAFAQWTTIYSDNFDSATAQNTGNSTSAIGVYSGSNVYASKGTWNGGTGTTGLDAAGGALQLGAGNYMVLSYFTNAGSSVDLSNAATSAIKVEFDYNASLTTSLFRIGMFDSMNDASGTYTRAALATDGQLSGGNSTAVTSLNRTTQMTAATPYAAWSGYYLGINPSNSSGMQSVRIDQRGFTSTAIITSTSAGNLRYHSLNTQTFNGAATAVTSDVDLYHLTYTIAYNTGTTPTLTFSTLITDKTTSSTILNSSYTTTQINSGTWQTAITSATTNAQRFMGGTKFDTIGFGPGTSTAIVLDNLNISTVPEPATYAACMGALSLLVVGYRRFRR